MKIYDIEGTSENDVWFVGAEGIIYHWNGNNFSKMNSPTSENINMIQFLDENNGWGCGDGGVVLRYSK